MLCIKQVILSRAGPFIWESLSFIYQTDLQKWRSVLFYHYPPLCRKYWQVLGGTGGYRWVLGRTGGYGWILVSTGGYSRVTGRLRWHLDWSVLVGTGGYCRGTCSGPMLWDVLGAQVVRYVRCHLGSSRLRRLTSPLHKDDTHMRRLPQVATMSPLGCQQYQNLQCVHCQGMHGK